MLNELHLEAAINLNMLRDGEKGQHGPGLRPSEVAGVQRDGWLTESTGVKNGYNVDLKCVVSQP